MEYCIVFRNNIQDFEATVTNYMVAGWKPCGGVFVVSGQGISLTAYYQSMTREK
jgi:hypothetical protein